MQPHVYESADDLQARIGHQLQQLRISMDLEQAEIAARAGISVRALRQLEHGKGSSMATFVRVLRALHVVERLDTLFPQATVSPMAMLRESKTRKRVGKPRAR